jgi:hypothetical protein
MKMDRSTASSNSWLILLPDSSCKILLFADGSYMKGCCATHGTRLAGRKSHTAGAHHATNRRFSIQVPTGDTVSGVGWGMGAREDGTWQNEKV